MSVISHGLFYTRTGKGSRTLLFFHGFGQDHTAFTTLAETLGDHYTCYLLDIYFHGNSKWASGEEPLEKSEWKKIIGQILLENNIDEFSMLGYSMGAKFVFATLEAFPEQIRHVTLIAPDGIKTSGWYSLATYPVMMRSFFRSMIDHHSRFLSLAHLLARLNLMDRGLIKFAQLQMNTEEKRKRVYYSWVVFRHLAFDMHHVAALINKHAINVTIVVGKYDKVIRPENMNQLLRHIPRHQFVILEAGHNNLITHPSLPTLLKA